MRSHARVMTEPESKSYLQDEGVLEVLESVSGAPGQFPPDMVDLARLYWLAVSRKVFTVLEFGVGWSTLVLALAIRNNRLRWNGTKDRPEIRSHTAFSVYSVDGSNKWIDNVKSMLPSDLAEYVNVQYAPIEVSTFNHYMCHYYELLPDVVPDLIYLDGPHREHVHGDVNGLSWQNPDRTLIAGDILIMEPTLLPGTCILVDGRTNNARFLANNLQRSWDVFHDISGDVTVLELQEPPLGQINERTLRYCLGDRYFERMGLTSEAIPSVPENEEYAGGTSLTLSDSKRARR